MHSLDASISAALKSVFKKEINDSPESHFLHRLHCVLLVMEGCSYQQVAEWFGMHQRTVERWVHYFKEYGIEGLKDEQKTGRPSKIRDDQFRQLQCDILARPFELRYNKDKWSGKLIKEHLKRRYDIEMSVRQCQRLLRQLQNKTISKTH